jgi:hypothetical protein
MNENRHFLICAIGVIRDSFRLRPPRISANSSMKLPAHFLSKAVAFKNPNGDEPQRTQRRAEEKKAVKTEHGSSLISANLD